MKNLILKKSDNDMKDSKQNASKESATVRELLEGCKILIKKIDNFLDNKKLKRDQSKATDIQ